MFRQLIACFLLVCLLSGVLHTGHDLAVADLHATDETTLAACDTTADHPCHTDGHSNSHSNHCCDTHSHLSAITDQLSDISHPKHEKQFTATIPHLTPQDFCRIPFIPPRTAV